MSELGSGSGSSFPGSIDTDNTQEVNSPNAGKTKARAEVVNDLAAAIVAVQGELGTDPAGSLATVKAFLQTQHGADGTHTAITATSYAGGNVVVTDGRVEFDTGADVASASALPVLSDGNIFDVTGTTTVTSINTLGVGTMIILHFDGALTLTHHATDLVLPGGNNITTVAGDSGIFYEYAAGDWRLASYSQSSTSGTSITLSTDGGATPTANTLYKDSIVKAWGNLDGTGTIAYNDSFNMQTDGLTDNGTGAYSVLIGTDMADAVYAVIGSGGAFDSNITIHTRATTGFDIRCKDDTGTVQDRDEISFVVLGAQ